MRVNSNFLFSKKHFFYLLFLFFSISLFIYFPTKNFYFYQDDFVWLSFAKDIPHHWLSVFSLKISNFFMPVIYSYFTFAYAVFGLHTFYYYLINILLHAINATLLFLLIKKIVNLKAGFVAAIFFLTLRYPMEAVVWISAITVLFTTFFILLSSIFWIYFLETKKIIWYIFTLVSSLLLILTKEWSVLLLPFLMAVSLIFNVKNEKQKIDKKIFFYLLPIFILFIIYSGIEFFLQKSSVLATQNIYSFGLHAINNIVNNLFLTIAPLTNLAYKYTQMWFIASSFFIILALVCSIWLYKKQQNPAVWGLIWAFIAFFPTSFFTGHSFVSRYSYLPAIGFSIFIGCLSLAFDKKMQKKFFGLLIIYLVLNIFFTHKVLQNFYLPFHKENLLFHQAAQNIIPIIKDQNMVAIYNNVPHKDFILPDIFYAIYNFPKDRIRVLPNNYPCPPEFACLEWQPESKDFMLYSAIKK